MLQKLLQPFTESALYALLVILILIIGLPRILGLLSSRLPPKVYGLPLLGYLPFLGDNGFLTLDKLGQDKGGIFRLQLGVKEVLVITDFRILKEAFQKNAFSGRPSTSALISHNDSIGFVHMSGEEWRVERQFAVKTMHNMGYGNVKTENHLKDESRALVEIIRKNCGAPYIVGPYIQSSVGNNIVMFLYGYGLPPDDQNRIDLDNAGRNLNANVKQLSPEELLPSFLKQLFRNSRLKIIRLARVTIEKIFAKAIGAHETDLDADNPRGYVDEYLWVMKNNKVANFSKKILGGNMRLIYLAGINTVTTTLEWLLVAMAAHPDIQKRVQGDIDRVIGQDGDPAWNDRIMLPYVCAVLQEVQRWRTAFPLSIFRRTTEDTTAGGYHIPKDIVVVPNLWSIHNDPKIWPQPKEFRPERFLSKDGTQVLQKEAFVAFSFGKRACPGEMLADMELFFYFVFLMKTFNVSAPKGRIADTDGHFATAYIPKMQEFLFTLRS